MMLVADGPRLRNHHALCPCAGFARCESEAVAQIQHRSTAVQQQGLEFVSTAMSRAGPQDASWADKLVLQSCLEVSAADRRLHILCWVHLLSICMPAVLFGIHKGRPGSSPSMLALACRLWWRQLRETLALARSQRRA